MRLCAPLRAAHDSGPRRARSIRLIVCHSTEGGTARSNAGFFHTTARASTQLVVGDGECYRCLPDLVIPWAAPGANVSGLHIEHVGFARWPRSTWLEHVAMLHLSAEHAARWAWQYRIPRRWLGPARIRLGFRGFCRHADVSRAFGTPGGHTDPGEGFPRDLYMQLVRAAYARLVDERKAAGKT